MDETIKTNSTIWTPAFISLFVINIFVQMGMYMMNSIVPKYASDMGAGPSVIGFVASLYGIASVLMTPINGPAFDAFSKRRILSLATGATGCVLVLYALAPSLSVVMVARFLHGVTAGCVIPLCLLLASDCLPEDKLSTGIGIFSLAQCGASAIAPGIGLALAERFGFRTTFLIGAAATFLSFGLTFLIRKNPNEERKPFVIRFDNIISRRALIPGGVMFFCIMGLVCINSFLVVFADALGVAGIGLYFTVYAVGLMIVQPAFGRIADKIGITKVVIIGTVVYALSFVLVGRSVTLPMFLAAAVLASIGYGALHPTMQSLTIQCAEEGRRGAASNTYYFCLNVSMVVAPLLAGWIADAMTEGGTNLVRGYSTMFTCVVVPILIALCYYLFMRKKLPDTVRQ
ncbi:MAG: MFS transporter [Oscillospiraceae bacterium]|nr:MFS transporter [Oscillospiraceae bacterium]